MQDWEYQWKMSQEVKFSRKTGKIIHPPLYSKNETMTLKHTQKHLDLQLDSKSSFNEHANNKISRARNGIELLRNCNLFYHTGAY